MSNNQVVLIVGGIMGAALLLLLVAGVVMKLRSNGGSRAPVDVAAEGNDEPAATNASVWGPERRTGDTGELLEAYEAFVAAVKAKQGKVAANLITERSLSFYDNLRRLARSGGVDQHPSEELLARLRGDPGEAALASMSPAEVFAHCVDRGWVAQDAPSVVFHSIRIWSRVDSAQGETSAGRKVMFKREGGAWKLSVEMAVLQPDSRSGGPSQVVSRSTPQECWAAMVRAGNRNDTKTLVDSVDRATMQWYGALARAVKSDRRAQVQRRSFEEQLLILLARQSVPTNEIASLDGNDFCRRDLGGGWSGVFLRQRSGLAQPGRIERVEIKGSRATAVVHGDLEVSFSLEGESWKLNLKSLIHPTQAKAPQGGPGNLLLDTRPRRRPRDAKWLAAEFLRNTGQTILPELWDPSR